jgi:aminoglycoside phosphotransferase (APT) family kinase protein
MLDQPSSIRIGEELDLAKLATYLKGTIEGVSEISIQQFPSGYSNLTYLIQSGKEEYILRRPPFGANIKSAHDMEREYHVLSLLRTTGFTKAPAPVLLCTDETIIGAKFYLMKRVQGIILRNRVPKGITIEATTFNQLSKAAIDQLAQLHQLDVKSSGLDQLGKPEGYVQRQVEGWTKRYFNAQTDNIPAMNEAADWMQKNIPTSTRISLIHNDYKYDNLVLNADNLTEIKAILDWEMATIGDPLMDVGTTLAYWAEANDSDALKPFNLTWMPGNLTRTEVAQYYAEKSGTNIDHIVFYYVFGSFKVAVICQQIYHRFKQGHTQDPRFAMLIHVIKACAENARKAISNSVI